MTPRELQLRGRVLQTIKSRPGIAYQDVFPWVQADHPAYEYKMAEIDSALRSLRQEGKVEYRAAEPSGWFPVA